MWWTPTWQPTSIRSRTMRLVARIESQVIDGRVLDLIRGWLKADILKGLERWTPVQGSPARGGDQPAAGQHLSRPAG